MHMQCDVTKHRETTEKNGNTHRYPITHNDTYLKLIILGGGFVFIFDVRAPKRLENPFVLAGKILALINSLNVIFFFGVSGFSMKPGCDSRLISDSFMA